MHAHPPGLAILACSGALVLAACAPRSETAAHPPVAIGAAQRINLEASAGSVAAAPVATLAVAPLAVSTGEAVEIHLPDGTVGVRVAKRYYHTISVCRQPDGSFSSNCPTPADTP